MCSRHETDRPSVQPVRWHSSREGTVQTRPVRGPHPGPVPVNGVCALAVPAHVPDWAALLFETLSGLCQREVHGERKCQRIAKLHTTGRYSLSPRIHLPGSVSGGQYDILR
uniref:Uncharacterized protein n=1 Tax=Cacopsylla melanoneura TaxID=428564 RepID=A0A8D8LK89_9HEMI